MPEVTRRGFLAETIRSRFSILFGFLILTLALPGFAPHGPLLDLSVEILTGLMLIAGLYAVSEERIAVFIGLALALPALVFNWLGRGIGHEGIGALGDVFAILFLIYLAERILRHVLRAPQVNTNILYAAVSVYLLMGYIFAISFSVLTFVRPDALAYPDLVPFMSERLNLLYYSFVTLTTLGYGDITPTIAPARALSILEAISGQLFLVVLIARLVGLHIAGGRRIDIVADESG